MSKQLAFYFEQEHCTGCFTCQIACKDKNNLEVGEQFRKVYEITGGNYMKKGNAIIQDIYAFWTSISCNHCIDPVCVKTCKTGALNKRVEDGIVVIDKNKCVGCRACVNSCPYEAIQYDSYSKKARKCDFCLDLIESGKDPVCVSACPMRALDYGNLEELQEKYGTINETDGLPSSKITKPALVITPHKNAVKKQGGTRIMDSIKQWSSERKIIYYILSLFYDGKIDRGFEILNRSNLLYNFKNYSENKQLSNGACEIIMELNKNNYADYKKAVLEEYQRLFLGPNELLAPLWESVYKTKDKLLFGDIELKVRRYYNSVGLDFKTSEPADYLPLQLSFMSRLCSINEEYSLEKLNDDSELEKINENLAKQKDFLNKHLLSWIPLWVEDVNKNAEGQFWKVFSKITEGWLQNDLMEIEKVYSKNANFLSVRK